ncbi:hypothetical protein [Salinibacter altiplanensis]|uniref:hypothetical protein n=1 Tax=Salinibacter altiplanensis TaxID=1803181 RepID=UPI001E4B3BE2|nr:hypothetical protein [Salinibacter altiplanensis]
MAALGSLPPRLLVRWLVGLCLATGVLAGCGGGDTYSVDEGELSQRFLPAERTVDHHPDSLEALTISEGDDKVQFQTERDFESLTEKWSSSLQNVGTGRSFRSRTYATFWSLELSLMSLQPEVGVLSLRKEQAREVLDDRRAEYAETIHIDVYWFVERGMNGIITGPSARTELRVGEETHRPIQSDHGPLREAFVSGGQTVLYRRNSLFFPRRVGGTDILANASKMELRVRQTGRGSRQEFSWRWADSETAQGATQEAPRSSAEALGPATPLGSP